MTEDYYSSVLAGGCFRLPSGSYIASDGHVCPDECRPYQPLVEALEQAQEQLWHAGLTREAFVCEEALVAFRASSWDAE